MKCSKFRKLSHGLASTLLIWSCSKSPSAPESNATDLPPSSDTATATDLDPLEGGTDTRTEDAGSTDEGEIPIADIEYVLDPYEAAELAAVVKVRHEGLRPEAVTSIHLSITGPDGTSDALTADFEPQTEAFQDNFDMRDLLTTGAVGIPVLGLYPGGENLVNVVLSTPDADYSGEIVIPVPTIDRMEEEQVFVTVADEGAMEPGWTAINGRIYDNDGNYRWVGPQVHYILQNGNFLDDTRIDEVNLLGKTVVSRMDLLPPSFMTHHDSVEIPGGHILACINDSATEIIDGTGEEIDSIEDAVIELEATSGVIQNYWDLREFFDVDRDTLAYDPGDWFHLNTVTYDDFDDTILVSGRYQGIAKLSRHGVQGDLPNQGKELLWIIAPHLDFDLAGWNGNGPVDPNDYLLTAVDGNGVPYDESVQQNLAPPAPGLDDFHWPLGQHGIRITAREEGTISFVTFNNQASVIFDGPGTRQNLLQGNRSNDRSVEPYSAVIEYQVDETSRTVRQIWSYGVNNPDLFCSYRSGVKLMKETGNRLVFSCGVDRANEEENPLNPHVVEVDLLGDAFFHMKIENTDMSLYRAARIDIHHPDRSAE